MDPADILTPDELAERLKTSRHWVFEMTRKRQRNPIPHYKIGRYLRFNWKEVCDWLETTKEGTRARTKNGWPNSELRHGVATAETISENEGQRQENAGAEWTKNRRSRK